MEEQVSTQSLSSKIKKEAILVQILVNSESIQVEVDKKKLWVNYPNLMLQEILLQLCLLIKRSSKEKNVIY